MTDIFIIGGPPPEVRCDFCNEQPVMARYHADSFVVSTFSLAGLTQESVGDWAACAECSKLIDAGEWDAVAERVAKRFIEAHPGVSLVMTKKDLKLEFKLLYEKLLRNGFKRVFYSPTKEDVLWAQSTLNRLTHGGIIGMPDAQLIFRVDHVLHRLVLINPDRLVYPESNETFLRTIETFKLVGYTVEIDRPRNAENN